MLNTRCAPVHLPLLALAYDTFSQLTAGHWMAAQTLHLHPTHHGLCYAHDLADRQGGHLRPQGQGALHAPRSALSIRGVSDPGRPQAIYRAITHAGWRRNTCGSPSLCARGTRRVACRAGPTTLPHERGVLDRDTAPHTEGGGPDALQEARVVRSGRAAGG